MIIELIGPSGSGKSTFVNEAIVKSRTFDNVEMAAWRGLLNHPKIKVFGAFLWRLFPARLAYRLRITKMVELYRDQLIRSHSKAYENLLITAQQLINNLADATIDEKLWLMDNFTRTVVNYALISQPINAKRLILADEFFLQKAVRLSGENSNNVGSYLALVPKPKVVLLFDAEPKVLVERIRSRSGSRNIRTRSMTDEVLLQKLLTSKNVTNELVAVLEKTGAKKFRIENEGDRNRVINDLKKIYA